MRADSLWKRVLFAIGLPVLLLLAWWIFSAGSTNYFWPPLSKILGVLPETWIDEGRIVSDVGPSLMRLAVGYGIALVLGIAAGVAVGSSRALRALLDPLFDFFRALPPPVLIPVFMVFLGIDDLMKIVVIAMGCIWPILLNTVEGVRQVDEVQRDTATVFHLGRGLRLFRLTLPAAGPLILAGARQGLSIGIILMVISEMFAATNGIGFSIQQFQRTFAVPEMWTGVIVLGIIGVLLAALFRMVERRVLGWYERLHMAHRNEG